MNLAEFQQSAVERGWKPISGGAVGTYKGYPFSAVFHSIAGGRAVVTFRLDAKRSAVKAVYKAIHKSMPKNAGLTVESNSEPGGISLSCDADTVLAGMDAVVLGLREAHLGPSEFCPLCKQRGCNATVLLGGGYVPVHKECVERQRDHLLDKASSGAGGNYFTGLLGAILGGLVGTIPAIIGLSFLDYYVALLYALIPLGASFGYRLFKGKANSAAFVCTLFSSLLNLFTLEFISVYIQLGQIRSSIPTMGYAFQVFMDFAQDGAFIGQVLMHLLFLVLGISVVWRQIRRTPAGDARSIAAVMDTLLVDGETVPSSGGQE